MGAPQFMPSSYRRYGVDADTDKQRRSVERLGDIFASVANYLNEYGWDRVRRCWPRRSSTRIATFQIEPRNARSHRDARRPQAMRGVSIDSDLPGNTPAVLIAAEQHDGPAYRVGFKNFYVISRYNRSARYAMAVDDLAQAIAAARA